MGGDNMKRALISVSDKTGIEAFAKQLSEMGIEIVSTGGTAKRIEDAGIPVIRVSELTGFPECLDGRVKTLHPVIHAGLLAVRDSEDHMAQLKKLKIDPIDYVVINLYPFKETISKSDVTFEDAIENIDIGGPTMLRSAAKNFKSVTVITDPRDYEKVAQEIKSFGDTTYGTKYDLALKVFEHTSAYDTIIAGYLKKEAGKDVYPETLTMTFEKVQDLRYGENPHQKAAFYKAFGMEKGSLVDGEQLHGKALSFNNINDTNGALELLKEYDEPTVIGVKHTNACGAGSGYDIYDAYLKAYNSDPKSIFGGIIAANRPVDYRIAEEINKIFIEIVVAPDFDDDALEILKQKKNIRLIKLPSIMERQPEGAYNLKKVAGGLLIQELDRPLMEEFETVTERIPTDKEKEDLLFAWKVVKHIKSNGIVIAKDKHTIGVGPGQVNRIWAVENCVKQALVETKGSVMASDAFFPFPDSVEEAAKAGVTAIIQPGGSMNDSASIEKANQYGIAMIFTGMRHFKH
jgi:phosphoribosylaminoimidazolecarboxamide formyltransferase/IMP cyclohydrolase